jgi:hypothetical protein
VVLEGSDLVSLLQFLLSSSRGDLNMSFSKNSYFFESRENIHPVCRSTWFP